MKTGWEERYSLLRDRVLAFIERGEGTFEELAAEIHCFQFRNNSAFRSFCERRGIGEKVNDWREIPAVPQQAFKVSELTTFPKEFMLREFRTSGTTGQGFGSHFFCDLSLYDAAIAGGLKHLELPLSRAFVLTQPPSEAPHSSLSYMMARIVHGQEGRFYLSNSGLQEERLRMDLGKTKEPVLVLGTALAFLNLMEKAEENLILPEGSYLFETGGYKGSGRSLSKADLYLQLERFFGVTKTRIVNEYGMTELSSQFYSFGLEQVHSGGPWIRHRVINPLTRAEVADGEVGILQLFDLANVGSVLAIQTEDLAMRKGSNFLLLGRDPQATLRGCSRSADDLLNR